MKKNKKTIIVCVIIAIIAIMIGIYNIYSSYLFGDGGYIQDSKAQLIEHIKGIEDKNERKNQIDFSVEQNIITQDEANELY